MLRRRGWLGRSSAILWAVLQFALPAIASGADARLERDGRAQVAHIEATSASTCRPSHEAACALCQLLTHHAVTPPASMPPAAPPGVPLGVVSECRTPATAWLDGLPPVRAPPVG